MSGVTKWWGLIAAVLAIGALGQRLQAEDPAPAARAMATLKVDGMS